MQTITAFFYFVLPDRIRMQGLSGLTGTPQLMYALDLV